MSHAAHEMHERSLLADMGGPLTDAATSPWQQLSWVRACAESAAAERPLELVTVGNPRAPAALAPLYAHRDVPYLRLVNSWHGEPVDFLYEDHASLRALLEELRRRGKPLFLERVPLRSPTVRQMSEIFEGRASVNIRPANPSPMIRLDQTWERPEEHFSSKRRRHFRYAMRLAERQGPVVIEILEDQDKVLGALDDAFAVEREAWQGRNLQNSHDPKTQLGHFFRLYCTAATGEGVLRLALLRIAGRPVSMFIATELDDRLWILRMAYDEAYADCSPGMLLMLELVRWATSRKLLTYEHLGKEESLSRLWNMDGNECVSIRILPYNMHGVRALTKLAYRKGVTYARRRPRQIAHEASHIV